MNEDEILAGLCGEAQAAAEELVHETLPELRLPGDVTLDEYIEAAKKRGIAFRNRRQAIHYITKSAGMVRLEVWDPLAKTLMRVYRRQRDGAEAEDQSGAD